MSTSDNSSTVRVRVKRVSNYITGKTIGRGNFGDVRIATHMITGEKVALKILEKSRIACDDDFKRVVREIQVLKLLNHPNIVKLLEVIDTPRHIYLVTEFVDNGELFKYVVEKKRLDEREACKFLHQIVAGLYYCHKRHVAHRDMKLENVLLDSSMNIKIIDFGLSNILSTDGAKLKTACGSPSYAAPEVLQGKRYSGPYVDIWAVGIIMFAMLCGHLPFDDGNVERLYKKIISGVFTIPSHVSKDAADLLKHILVVDPERRYSLDDIMAHPWFTGNYIGPRIPLNDCEFSKLIDFRVIYTMVDSIPEWTAAKIIRALNGNRHNQLTATYYLLSERRQAGGPKAWDIEDQRKYAAALGFRLGDDGRLIQEQVPVDPAVEGDDDEAVVTIGNIHGEVTQSEAAPL